MRTTRLAIAVKMALLRRKSPTSSTIATDILRRLASYGRQTGKPTRDRMLMQWAAVASHQSRRPA